MFFMNIPVPWAIALGVAGFVGIVALVGVLTGGRSPLAAALVPLLHLCAGGLVGYLFVAFYPALPLVAAIGGMLGIRAVRGRRWTDAALLVVGFGTAWTVLFGWAAVNDALDPALSGSGSTIPFLAGAVVTVAGLLFLIGRTVWPVNLPRRAPRRPRA